MSALEFRDVTVRFGTGPPAVDAVSLRVPAGTVVGLVGGSGSGKSTLAGAAVGLHRLDGGSITLGGGPVRRRSVQLVFQDPYSSLDPRMTVGSSIAEALEVGRRERGARVRRLLELVHLDPDSAKALPAALSGGQRQRVALARALAARPDVVIADEITSALDVSVQGSVLNLIRELQRDLGLSMLFISHNLAVVRYVSDEIAVMSAGRLVEHGPAERVLAAPEHEHTRTLLAAVPKLGESL